MVTLCVRYKFNPDKIAGIRNYFENEQRVIERSGGRTVGCFLPTDFAGPTDEASAHAHAFTSAAAWQ